MVLVGAFAIGLGRQEPADAGVADGGTPPSAEASDGRFPLVAYQGVESLGAERLDFTDLLGRGTPVVLNFWAACPGCLSEVRALQRVYDRYGSDFLLVGVDIGPFYQLGTRESAIALLDELDITYPAAYAVDDRAMRDYGIVGIPTTVFYNADGTEAGRRTGVQTEAEIEARVRELTGLGA